MGQVTVDVCIPCEEFPPKGMQRLIPAYRLVPGGGALNTAVTMAGLDVPTSLIACIGDDAAGQLASAFLQSRQVDISKIERTATHPTGLSVIRADRDDVSILHCEGANRVLGARHIDEWPRNEYGFLHISGAMLLPSLDGNRCAEVLQQFRGTECITSIGTARNTEQAAVVLPAIPHCDYVFMSRHEALDISNAATIEAAAKWFCSHGAGAAVITLGVDGAYHRDQTTEAFVDGEKLDAADTTGCGDAFVAGFLWGVQRELPPDRCLLAGNLVAAHCARVWGPVGPPFSGSVMLKMVETRERIGPVLALVLAGGESKRMDGTDQKLLMELEGKLLIEWVVDALRAAGATRIVLALGHRRDAMISALRGRSVEYVDASGANGTGAAILACCNALTPFPENVLVMNGDTPLVSSGTLEGLLRDHSQSGSSVVVATALSPNPRRYGHGRVVRGPNGRFAGIQHFSACTERDSTTEVNTGTYCFSGVDLNEAVRHLLPAVDGHLHFSDVLDVMRRHDCVVTVKLHDDFDEFISANTREDIEDLKSLTRLRRT